MAFTKAGLWGPEAVIDATGHALPGATAAVYLSDGVTLASLWTTSAKSVVMANPTQADVHGNLHFYADPGPYVLKITVGGTTSTLTVEVPIDPGEAAQDQDVVAAQAAAEAYADGIVAAGLATKQPLDSDLTAIAALATTAFGRGLLILADAAAGRVAFGSVIGTDVQAHDSDLDAIAALATTAFGRALLVLADAAALRTAAGLGSAATHASTDFDAAGAASAAVTALVAGAPGALDTLNELATALADDANFATTITNALAGKQQAVARTAVKTTNYSAAAGDLVPVDTTSGAVTVTLPNAPTDKSTIAVKHIIQGGTNVVTIACAGADVFNRAGGGTSATLPYANQAMLLEYTAAGAIWSVIADDLPLSQLDLRFAPITGIPESAVTSLATDLAAKAPILAPTAVKTANYTAAVGDYVLCDTSGGIFTVTLPTAPADKTTIAVDLVASGNTLTIARGGADVFQKAGGPTSLTMNTANRVLVLQYQSSIAVWHVQDHLPAVITTKGDLLTYGTERARLPVGADGALLGADSTQTTGLKWVPPGAYVPTLTTFWDAISDGGCKADTVELADAMMVAGTTTLTSASANFTAADIGKKAAICGVGTGGSAITSSGNQITAVTDAHTVTVQKTAVVSSVAARSVADGVTTINSQTITSATAAFTAGDVGKFITITNGGETGRRILTEQASMTSGAATLTAAYGCFTAGMVGQKVKVSGAAAAAGPLVATISAYISATQVTLDTNAGATVAGALVQVWTVADLVTLISTYVNATTVTIQRWASATLTGATFSIGGHQAVYGTDDAATLTAWAATLPARARIVIRPGRLIFLASGGLSVAQSARFESQDRESGGFHVGANSGRVTAGSDDVDFVNVHFRALHNGSTDLFTNRSATNYKNWKFLDCVFDGVRPNFGTIGAVQDDGTILTSTSGFTGPLTFVRPVVRNNLGDGMHFDSVDGFDIDNPYVHDVGTTAAAAGGWALKFANGAKGKVRGGLIEWCGKDGVDNYDSKDIEIIGLEVRHCANIGISSKWQTTQQYQGNGRQRYIGCRVWNCNSGAQLNIHRGAEIGIHAYGNITYGVRYAVAADTNVAADPSVYSLLGYIISVGNGAAGVGIGSGGSANRGIISNVHAHNNGTDGITLDCAETILSDYQAFNNGINGCQLTANATKNQLWAGHTQDANGMATVTAGASLNLFNGFGQEAAGAGNSPTLATWPVGATVKNTDDSTTWRHELSGWNNISGGGGSPAIYPVHVQINAATFPAATSGHTFNQVGRDTSAFGSTIRFQTSTAANADSVSWDVVLQAGTWRLDVLEKLESDAAIYQPSVDGTNVGTTSDLYNAGNTARVTSTTGIVVSTTKLVRITFTVTGKNASSSGFFLTLSGFTMTKTA